MVGGRKPGGGAVSTVLAYDPTLDSWCEVASIAMGRCALGAVALGGKLYVMGGIVDRGEEFAEAEVYDRKADGWQPLPSMPMVRTYLAAAAVAGKLYAIGGEIVNEDTDDDDESRLPTTYCRRSRSLRSNVWCVDSDSEPERGSQLSHRHFIRR